MKIPKYVQELVKQRRIRPAPLDEQGELYDQKLGEYGFMFRVYRRDNYYRDYTFEAEVKRLVAWANRNYAEGVGLQVPLVYGQGTPQALLQAGLRRGVDHRPCGEAVGEND